MFCLLKCCFSFDANDDIIVATTPARNTSRSNPIPFQNEKIHNVSRNSIKRQEKISWQEVLSENQVKEKITRQEVLEDNDDLQFHMDENKDIHLKN